MYLYTSTTIKSHKKKLDIYNKATRELAYLFSKDFNEENNVDPPSTVSKINKSSH